MRARILSPAFFMDEDLAKLPPQTILLFAGLLCYVDDYGNGRWLPKAIEGAVFPYVAVDILQMLGELERGGFIARYTTQNVPAFTVWSFSKWQVGIKYFTKTDIPAPPENYDWSRDAPLVEPRLLLVDNPVDNPVSKDSQKL